MKSTLSTLCTLLFMLSQLFSQPQTVNFGGGGAAHYNTPQRKCLSDSQRASIKEQLNENVKQLREAGLLKTISDEAIVSFEFPLRENAALNFSNFYGISNYVDQDASTNILDYNCNAKSYNGHRGTDFFTWPFPWYLYENDLVDVIAAASGTIIYKQDNEFDQHCQWNNQNQWNAVYIQHVDGSVAWYGHLKANSLTTKSVGSTVAQGEYLGVVASSGVSDGPHLHLEIYDNFNNLIDPYQGNCNGLNNSSWWQAQLPHTQPRINAALTHGAPPVNDCPLMNEATNFENNFAPGETIYMGAYYTDQIEGQTATLTVRTPNLSVYWTWEQTFEQSFNASWWWWSGILPEGVPFGTWRFDITLNGEAVIHPFEYQEVNLSVELIDFTATLTDKNETLLNWQTASETNNNGFEIQHAIDANTWQKIGFVEGAGIAARYAHIHSNPQAGINYYRLKQVDNNGDVEYSKVISIKVSRSGDISIYPSPTNGKINIIGIESQDAVIEIYSSTGMLVADFVFDESEIDISHLANGLYFISIQSNQLITTQKIIKN